MFEKKVKVLEQKGVKKEVKVVKKGNGNSIGEKVLSALKIWIYFFCAVFNDASC